MAADIKTVVKIGMDYTEITGGTTEINRKMKLLDSEFRKTQESAKAYGTSVDELSNKEEYLTQKVSLQTQKVKNMKDEYERIRKEKGENSKEAEKYATSINYAERALIKLEAELKDTTEKLKDQSTKFDELQKKLGEYGEKAGKISKTTGEIGNGFLKASAPIIAFSVVTGKAAMDFEEAMAKVSLMVDTNEVDMEKMGESVKTLSNTYGISSKEIANALYETMSAGVSAADSITFLDTAIKNGRTGIADTVTSVNTLTNVMNAYGIETEKALEISDKLLMLQKFGKTTVGQFGNELGRLAPLAAQTGVSVEEMFSSIATLTKNSIESSQALTGMRSIISAVIKPTSEAGEEARRVGLRFNAAALQGKGFEQFLEDVMRKTHGNTESLTKLFGNVNALNAIMLLTSEKGSKDFKEALEQINDATGMTDEGMEKLDTSSQRLQKAITNLQNSFAGAGEAILPILNAILRVVVPLLNAIGNINPKLLQMVTIIGTALAVIGGFLKMTSAISGVFSTLSAGLGNLNITGAKATLIIMGVVAAVIALLTLIVVLSDKTDDLDRATGSIGTSIGQIQGNVNNAMDPSSLPNIPRYAKGTKYHPGGRSLVGEEGPEIVDLPRGSRVYTAQETRQMLNGGGDTYILQVNMDEVDEVSKLMRVFNDFKQTKKAGVVRG